MSNFTRFRNGLRSVLAYALASAALVQPAGAQPPGKEPAAFAPLPPTPLTPAQEIADKLPAPMPGSMNPIPDVPAEGPWPSSDPRDLQGTWVHNQNLEFRMQRDMYGFRVPFTMAGAKILARRVNGTANGTPYINASAKCLPPGPQWQFDLNMPFQIFQSENWLQFVFEEYHGRWNVVFDPALLPQEKQYMGRAVAHWDGDTLVVESSDFKQDMWLDVDGTPLSANGKLIQRIRKVSQEGHRPYLEVITTIIDPAYYTEPWSVVRTFTWAPGLAVFKEYNCEEQVGDPSGTVDSGLVPEPKD